MRGRNEQLPRRSRLPTSRIYRLACISVEDRSLRPCQARIVRVPHHRHHPHWKLPKPLDHGRGGISIPINTGCLKMKRLVQWEGRRGQDNVSQEGGETFRGGMGPTTMQDDGNLASMSFSPRGPVELRTRFTIDLQTSLQLTKIDPRSRIRMTQKPSPPSFLASSPFSTVLTATNSSRTPSRSVVATLDAKTVPRSTQLPRSSQNRHS